MGPVNDSDPVKKHLALLRPDTKSLDESEVAGTPVFTESVRQQGNDGPDPAFTQYGLLGGNVAKLQVNQDGENVPRAEDDPRVYYNISAPSSVFICGSQGSGKSHTLSCLLENCLIPSEANVLPRPLTGIVFHYDPFFSGARGDPCEAAYISSNKDVRVRVLCPPTSVEPIRVCRLLEERSETVSILTFGRNCISVYQTSTCRNSASASAILIPKECWTSWQSVPFRAGECPCTCTLLLVS
jgi:hypothetical protein